MTTIILWLLILFGTFAYGQNSTFYKVSKGKLHTKGSVVVSILPDKDKFKVEMNYKLKKKRLVPVPEKLLIGKTIMEFPQEFRTERGYKELEKHKTLEIPKANLRFVKRADYGNLRNAYFLEVFPKNKKTKIDIIYHPSIPAVGWSLVEIEFISNIPVLDGYELQAKLVR
jgi:hypothetical protein